METLDQLLKIINTVLDNHQEKTISELKPEMTLRQDLGMDSIMLAEMTVRIEDETGVDVFENGMLYTVKDIFDIISKSK
jgi:acyl carrier protein